MEGEINKFTMVWSTVIISICYCYWVSKIVSKGMLRLIIILPVVFLFVILPFIMRSIHLGVATVFFISWLANFKLLLLSFGIGPLSDSSLPLSHFIFLACFPIKVQENPTPKPSPKKRKEIRRPLEIRQHKEGSRLNTSTTGLKSPLHYAKKGLILVFIISLYALKEYIHPKLIMFFIVMYLYIGLEIMLAIVGIICQKLLGLQLEQPFNQPYISSSLRDFWGHRWNLISTNALRLTVYNPMFHYSSRVLDHKWARILSIMSTFVMSALMHELMLYHIFRDGPTWGSALYFFGQGFCITIEDGLKKKFATSWRLPRVVTGLVIFMFETSTFAWLVISKLVRLNVDTRVVEEYLALGEFLIALSLNLKEKCCYLLVNYLKQH